MVGGIAGKLAIYGLAGMGLVGFFEGKQANANGPDMQQMVHELQQSVATLSAQSRHAMTGQTQGRNALPEHMQIQMPVPKPGGAARYLYWDYNDLVGIHKGPGGRTRNADAPAEQRLTTVATRQAQTASAIGIASAPINPAASHGFTSQFVQQSGERGPWGADEFRAPKPGEQINAMNAIPRAVGALEQVSRVLGSIGR
ncbi:MAG: hypothetical protein Alpg2KO_04160 [Alphaproteobacteria bacterium]